MVRSMLRMYEDGGHAARVGAGFQLHGMHDWLHSVPAIVDAKAWGIDDWDQSLALEAMVQAADSMHLGLDAYASLGFIPSTTSTKAFPKRWNTPSTTLALLGSLRALANAKLRRVLRSGPRTGATCSTSSLRSFSPKDKALGFRGLTHEK